MKKRSLTELACLGITSGVLFSTFSGIQASALENVENLNHEALLAANTLSEKSHCGMHSNCGGFNSQKKKTPQNKVIAQADVPDSKTSSSSDYDESQEGNIGYHLMTEDELMGLLNKQSRALYQSLDAEGKELALKVASQRCDGMNECKGLNACETANNKCAGLGDCKGKGKCAHADKNVAVKLVAKKMAEKRGQAIQKK